MLLVSNCLVSSQVPFYRGERITFDVAPSRLDFTVEHDSLKIEVRPPCLLEGRTFDVPSLGPGIANMFKKNQYFI